MRGVCLYCKSKGDIITDVAPFERSEKDSKLAGVECSVCGMMFLLRVGVDAEDLSFVQRIYRNVFKIANA